MRVEPLDLSMPMVIASICGHPLSGVDTPLDPNNIKAATITHCNSCIDSAEAAVNRGPHHALPAVVASTCQHPLVGDPLAPGQPTISAANISHCNACKPAKASVCQHNLPDEGALAIYTSNHPALCPSCHSFSALRKALAAARADRKAFRAKLPPRYTLEELKPFLPEGSRVFAALRHAKVAYANAAILRQEHEDPALPTVDEEGYVLLAEYPEGEGAGGPPKKRVTFDESVKHPEREKEERRRRRRPSRWAAEEEQDDDDAKGVFVDADELIRSFMECKINEIDSEANEIVEDYPPGLASQCLEDETGTEGISTVDCEVRVLTIERMIPRRQAIREEQCWTMPVSEK